MRVARSVQLGYTPHADLATIGRYPKLTDDDRSADMAVVDDDDMVANHPILRDYPRTERRAIEVHKYFLGIERGYDPPTEEAVDSWERFHALTWRSRKLRRDAEAQILEIECYRETLARDRGRQIEFNEAAREWIQRWAEKWRAQREAQADPVV